MAKLERACIGIIEIPIQKYMEKVITIPKEIIKKGDLVLIPRKEYEEFLRLRKQREWEEKDTEKAIKIFQREKRQKKLMKIKSLADLD